MFAAALPEAVLLLSCMHHPAVPGMMTTPEPTATLGVGCGVKKGAAALVCKLYKNHCHDAKETATPARLGGEGAFVCTRNVETLIKAPFFRASYGWMCGLFVHTPFLGTCSGRWPYVAPDIFLLLL